mmetsp:Transcript_4557/g.13776  ORF Transcript_4557/g.13776 Transcript_4557/m.13776 type:complete len:219 (+) Transcript_4557:1855-2511(+)
MAGRDELSELRKKAGLKPLVKTPLEEQHGLDDPPKVIFFYRDVIFEFGFTALFGVIEPSVIVALFLWNIYMIRENAGTLLNESRRPEARSASDIGSYMTVLSILATLSIITNAAIFGFTSSSLYFYFPSLTDLDRIWATAILEHLLLLCKLMVETLIPPEAGLARVRWEEAQAKKDRALKRWGIKDPDPHKFWDGKNLCFTGDPVEREEDEEEDEEDG